MRRSTSQVLMSLGKKLVATIYHCQTGSGTCPSELNPVTEAVSQDGSFTAPAGNRSEIAQCLSIAPPSPPSGGQSSGGCPGNLVPILTAITYSDIAITDLSNNIGPVSATPSTLNATLLVCPAP